MDGKKEELLVFEQRGQIWVGTVRTNSVLGAGNVVEFGNEVLGFIQRHPGLNLLLNFENVDYLSSAVLTELLRINKAITDTNGRLRLCAVSPVIREVFEITNLDKIFVIHSDGVAADLARFERAIQIEAQEAAWQEPGAER
jgi:anti-sigma B factor antagonist